ncbi:MAG TPA: N-acetylmuramoyl-L-alanine amidase [Chitinophagaceae bacterium]|nr:N-acetylmuramoyl-L-alanine amidase [Chitinophagaceae bacterium]MCB9056335.1 N-acetylmuramoyl-L-alanine amidase [Chitinophagales bacterium]HPG12184.1 N-acetylmuramoyl-L-alanine amidase [Chitinophagaceae bacterium]
MIKRTLFFFLAASLSFMVFSFSDNEEGVATPNQNVIKTIVVDPGHGGSDAGAHGEYSYEKDICLDISLKVGKLIQQEFPEVKLLYTRTTDSYPSLHGRADYANENKGDLFLCIHVNSAPSKKVVTGYKTVTYYSKGKKRTRKVAQYKRVPSTATGTETYIWGAHKSEDKEIAVRENAYMLKEDNYEKKYGDFNPESPEFVALTLLKTKQYFKRSATLAGFVQDEFAKVGRVDRDVKQRGVGIWVLQATAMPSVLVETGFISNPDEEKYLNSEAGQNEISVCIIKALKRYVKWLEDKKGQDIMPDSFEEKNTTSRSANDTREFLEAIDKKEKAALVK